MTRKLTDKKIVLASHNAGKLREIKALLNPFGIECMAAGDFDLEEPEETESTYAGNARIKAHFAAQQTGLPALSDDSGISIDALDGAPGVYTADWAETGSGRDFMQAMRRAQQELVKKKAMAPWLACFNCTLCLAWPDGHDEIFAGIAPGQVVWPVRGENGFGFDPMFVPNGYNITFAEMSPEQKAPLTHRARAFEQLVSECFRG